MTAPSSRRRLDHCVLPVRDLEAAAAFYARLGFQVGARNRHPWGTENRLIQFDGTFLELITLGAGAEPPPHGPARFSFGRHVADWIRDRGDGCSMLVVSSPDAAGDARWFRQAGIGAYDPFHFRREGKRADGSAVEVAFTLAFATPAAAEHLSFFTCQQHAPANFWNPALQKHSNTARGVARMVMTHPDPFAMAGFVKAFAGGAPLAESADGLTLTLAGSALSVWTPDAARRRLGDDPALFDLREGRLAAMVISVASLAHAEMAFRTANVPHRHERGGLLVPSGAAFGTLLVFREEQP